MQLPSPGLFTVLAACFGLSTDTAGALAPAYLGYERTALRSVHGHTNEAACGLIIMSETLLQLILVRYAEACNVVPTCLNEFL